jgi:cell shape-determining protein MreD
LLWLASLFFLLIKGNLLNHGQLSLFDVDLVIIIATYLLVFNGETGAGIFALSQGLVVDVFSGGLLGLFTLLYLTVFLGMNLGSRLLDLRSVKGQVIIISLAVLVKGILLFTFLNIFHLDIHVSGLVLWAFAASAACSGLLGPGVFYLLNHLKYFLVGDIREASGSEL